MLSCWQLKNSDRPTFSILAEQLEQLYSDVPESNSVAEVTYVNYKPE